MVTVCLTNVTALILKLMTSQELRSGERERCCPFPPHAWPVPAEGKPLKSWHCREHAQTDKSIRRRGCLSPAQLEAQLSQDLGVQSCVFLSSSTICAADGSALSSGPAGGGAGVLFALKDAEIQPVLSFSAIWCI